MNKINSRIVSLIILCTIFITVSTGTASVFKASKLIKEETNDKFSYVTQTYANKFSTTLASVEVSVNSITSVLKSSFDLKEFLNNPNYKNEFINLSDTIIKDIGLSIDDLEGIYLTLNPKLTGNVYNSRYIHDNKGNFVSQSPENTRNHPFNYVSTTAASDDGIDKSGKWVPNYDEGTINVNTISYIKPLYKNELLIGFVGIDIAYEDIHRLMEKTKIYKSSYAFLLDANQNILIHPTIETGTSLLAIENENLELIVDSMKQNQSKVIEYVFRNNEKIMGFSQLYNGWIFGVVSNSDDIFQPITQYRNNIIIIVLSIIIVSGMIGLYISRSITYLVINYAIKYLKQNSDT